MKLILRISILTMCCASALWAQEVKVGGKVASLEGEPLPGVSVFVKGNTGKGTLTDSQGMYTLTATPSDILVFSFIGFKTQEIIVGSQNTINVAFQPSYEELSEVIVTGTRSVGRTALETPVPVDVISIQDVMGDLPQIDLAQMLAILAPSFNASRSQGGDLNSHVDPAQLRNLAPNQTLVLVNGKRRHTSSLLIMSTAVGSPSTSVDMMMIPAAAVERVEILRDGAAAQYGSDAVAGVINIVLKKGTDKLTGSFTAGGYLNSGGDAGDLTIDGDPDGFNYQATANYGFSLGKRGFINLSGEVTQRKPTLRTFIYDYAAYDATYLNNERTDKFGNPVITNPELVAALASGNEALATSLRTNQGLMAARGLDQSDFTIYSGMPAITLGSTFYNAEFAINDNTKFYAFGGLAYKYLNGYSCYFRRPAQTDRFNYLLYPNGFRPQMTSNSGDFSTTVGLRSKVGEFNMDFSNTFGKNRMRIGMVNTFNASLGSLSPVEMNLGTHQFSQNSTNLDFSRQFNVLKGLNIAFGAEMRIENYKIIRGQEESYTYGNEGILTVEEDGLLVGPDGKPLEDGSSKPIVDGAGNPLVVGRGDQVTIKSFAPNCQCFAGFGPKNERDEFRTNLAAYVDAELEISDAVLVAGAVRVENYSDFGQVLTGKIAARYSILDNLTWRGSVSSGFRAPSLQELNYTHTATVFELDANRVPQPSDETTYPTNSTAARVLGIKELSEERSISFGTGLTYSVNHQLDFSIDAYQIDVDDRIFRTLAFDAAEVGNNYEEVIGQGQAQFFVNGADVRSRGIEIVGNYSLTLGGTSQLNFTLSGVFNKNEILKRKIVDLNVANLTDEELVEKYLDRSVIGQFETGTPRQKVIGSVNYAKGKFSTMLRGTYYGKVKDVSIFTDPDTDEYLDQTFSAQTVFDLSFSYSLTPNVRFSVGGNNVLDQYPDLYIPLRRDFTLYNGYQQGSNGAYYYARVMFNF
ncbi:TonB-dependent receptor [Chryseosolibacter indicus]|uniref:TonB-dependent receptor n=1 Tax=Chryseosolibacter indicus TaxID=2782351 RepID=A0ABS5VYX9_9BACT|nr:TonB-dependent receptor [Chryseosolibacter indicus]MBT1706072.1 TonB-dependent receptor [Chryseosolibacter indicus]